MGITKEEELSFLENVKDHEISILMENDVYRHVRFKRKNSLAYYFDLITVPGKLIYTGDMGTYVFERLEDMFCFFRFDERDFNYSHGKTIQTNLGYWAEKLISTPKEGHTEFSSELLKNSIEQIYEDYIDDAVLSEDDVQSLREEIDSFIDSIEYSDDDKTAFGYVCDFYWKAMDSNHDFDIRDFEFNSMYEYTFHYRWCCQAIAWGIMQYDKLKEK